MMMVEVVVNVNGKLSVLNLIILLSFFNELNLCWEMKNEKHKQTQTLLMDFLLLLLLL